MKILLVGILLKSVTGIAAGWEDRLLCYGTAFSGSDFVAEIEKPKSKKNKLVRDVLFQKNIRASSEYVTGECQLSNDFLICSNDKIEVEVDVSRGYSGGGLFDSAVRYSYYDAKITKRGFWGTTEEETRCRYARVD